MNVIYLDYNSTTPVHNTVLETMLPYFNEKFGNASSITHPYGWEAKRAVEQAAAKVAQALDCEEQQLVFTSGSTESINLGIRGVWELYSKPKGKHIITCQTEHKAVLDTCTYLEKYHGAQITYLPVNKDGLLDLQLLKKSINDQTILVAIMHVNNETGVIHDIKKISDIVHEANSILLSDCTQSIGKIPCLVDELGIDICCISAHKFYGPKGVGALFFRRKLPRVSILPQIHGGGQQKGMRAGTLNVPGIVGMGAAIELATNQLDQYQQIKKKTEYLEQTLAEFTPISIVAKKSPRVVNTTNIIFHDIKANRLIELTNGKIAVSTGSACTSEQLKASHVLQAMYGTNSELSSIRFSLGLPTTDQEISECINVIRDRIG